MKHLNKLEICSITYFLMRACFMGISLNIILNLTKQDSYMSILLGSILGFIPLLLYLYIIKDKKDLNLKDYLKKQNKYIGSIIWIIMFIFTLLYTSYIYHQFTHFIQIEYLSKTPRFIILLAFLIPLLYLVKKGIKVIAEVSTILFYFSVILLVITLSSLIFQINIENILPILTNKNNIFNSSLTYISFNVIPIFFLTNLPYTKENNYQKVIIKTYILSSIILFITTFLTISILGINLTKAYIYPEFHLLKQVSVIGFLGHLESILAFQGIFDSFIMLTINLYFLSTFINYKYITEICFIIFLITYLFSNTLLNYKFIIYGSIITYLVLPIFVIVYKKIKSKILHI